MCSENQVESWAQSLEARFNLWMRREIMWIILQEEFVRNVKRVSGRLMSLKLEVEGVMFNVVGGYAPQKDLVSTIGESVALGAAGVIFWGGSSYATSSGCSDLNDYFLGPMGRYLLNVTTAAKECSQKLCKFNGRCLRRAPDSAVFLPLSPSTHKIISQSGKLKVRGSPGQAELKTFRQHFKCQCYNGTKGESYSIKNIKKTGNVHKPVFHKGPAEGSRGQGPN
uniref:Hyaluronidase n=1 Tax=Poecilia mexicana TaxID=48701 RepID=A0A3B3Z128_9TELE